MYCESVGGYWASHQDQYFIIDINLYQARDIIQSHVNYSVFTILIVVQ